MCTVSYDVTADAHVTARASILHHDAGASDYLIVALSLHTVWVLIKWVALQAYL